MAIRVVEFYEVSDVYTEDGKGPTTVIARLADYNEAFRYAVGKGNYGGDANVRTVKFLIADTALDMEEYKREEKRQAALDKLTAEEIELLGLETR